jgi:hypothetical protein
VKLLRWALLIAIIFWPRRAHRDQDLVERARNSGAV